MNYCDPNLNLVVLKQLGMSSKDLGGKHQNYITYAHNVQDKYKREQK